MTNRYSSFKAASEMASELAKQGHSVTIKRDDDGWVLDDSGGKVESPVPLGEDTIWVGESPKTGALIVFDPSIKVEGIKNTYGYVVTRNVMRQFDEPAMKLAIRVSGARLGEALTKYRSWKQGNFNRFLEVELAAIKRKRDEAIQRHKKYLENIGKPYAGVNLSTSKRHRVTHCYACKESLQSSFHIECNACGWLICECGACGCNYSL